MGGDPSGLAASFGPAPQTLLSNDNHTATPSSWVLQPQDDKEDQKKKHRKLRCGDGSANKAGFSAVDPKSNHGENKSTRDKVVCAEVSRQRAVGEQYRSGNRSDICEPNHKTELTGKIREPSPENVANSNDSVLYVQKEMPTEALKRENHDCQFKGTGCDRMNISIQTQPMR